MQILNIVMIVNLDLKGRQDVFIGEAVTGKITVSHSMKISISEIV